MTSPNHSLRRGVYLFAVFACCIIAGLQAQAGSAKAQVKVVDSGSFGIYVNGRRIATETFTIREQAGGSITHSELKANGTVSQTADLEMTAGGELRRYKWTELSPGKAFAVVQPENEFLVAHIYASPADKPVDQPFLLPASTSILDDYFFVQRQVLAWRYLAANCTVESGQQRCRGVKAHFGALVPRQRTSVPITLELVGREKLTFKGTEQELNRFKLESDGSEWGLWMDDNLRLVRVVIASQNTEVIRD